MEDNYNERILQPSTRMAAVIAQNNLVSFVGGISRQDREDVLDSVLYMTQRANSRFNVRSNFEAWGRYYAEGLLDIGWSLDLRYAFEPSIPKLYESVGDLIKDQVSAVRHEAVRDMAVRSFEALNDHQVLSWFAAQAVVGHMASFEIVPCVHDEKGNVYMFTLGMSMSITNNFRDFLFPVRSRTGKALVVDFGASGMTLSRQRYATGRAYIRSRLAQRSRAAVRQYRVG
ncbi:MAG: hypothetical protein JWQ69_585 [Pseudomonas sp.]|nr:hypothetical protein [Pseudomonas sp.]